MTAHRGILKWGAQLNPKIPFVGRRVRRCACRRLAVDRTAAAVPFLVSALAHRDEEVRRVAREGLSSLDDPDAIEALYLGYCFTRDETVKEILAALGRPVSEDDPGQLPHSEPGEVSSPAEDAWRFHNSKDGTSLVYIPEGEFRAGKEGFPVHLPPYYMALTCVTNAQYARFLNECRPVDSKLSAWIGLDSSAAIRRENDTYSTNPADEDRPVVWVTWEGASAYCKWAGLRLPTELEWEKGARGVDGRQYPWGDEWEDGRPHHAEEAGESEGIPSVWAYPSARSPYGLCQMIGNIYEWCAEWYEEAAYARYAQRNLRPPAHGEHRALRGGEWRFATPAYLRNEYRKSTVWRAGTLLCGFRCAKSP